MGAWQAVTGLLKPVDDEKQRLLELRWRELPADLQVPWQVVGRQFTQCGYVMGPSYCSFGCTHCYLPSNANRAPLPTWDEMKAQIDANRRLLGHAGNLQITGGDVVDAYVRADRVDELVRVVRYAVDVGLVPMVMTHGQKLLEEPELLDRLVVEGRMRKLAIHIDITQAGRPGFPIREISREAELHPLRQQFVDLILASRKRTGVRFAAAHTLTVTDANVDQVGDVLSWLAASPDRLRAFRMVSLQPEAAVGRTRMGEQAVSPESCWAEVERWAGQGQEVPAGKDNLWFGDPRCSRMTTFLILNGGERIVDAVPSDDEGRAFWGRILDVYGGVGGRGAGRLDANLRRLGLTLRNPGILWEIVSFVRRRARREGLSLGRIVGQALRGRIGALNVVQHNFMDEAQVAAGGPEVERRLAACSFQGAVERDGRWEAVPMCSMNAVDREGIYARQIAADQAPAAES